MKTIERNVARRTAIEAYVRYDCGKKGLPVPDFAQWDWSAADSVDAEMVSARFKSGIPAGYLQWDKVEVTMSDLRDCAVDVAIFARGKPRSLWLLERGDEIVRWKPDRQTTWYESISRGQTLEAFAPLMLRPAERGEAPARWYVEDGSGRAIAFVANNTLFDPSQTLATVYLGTVPDPHSSFMKEKFQELLRGTWI
jgi:hypothetical protein